MRRKTRPLVQTRTATPGSLFTPMTHAEGTEKWYKAVIEALIVAALFSPPMLAVMDGLFAALCLPRMCGKGGCLTLWGLILNVVIFGVIVRYVPLT